jgi:exodeoxyribonuclease VII large subunit
VREKSELVRTVAQLTAGLSRRLVRRMAGDRSMLRSAAARLGRSARIISDAQLAHDALHVRLLQGLPRLCAGCRSAAATARARLLTLAPRQRLDTVRRGIGFLRDALCRNSMFVLERKRTRVQAGLSGLGALNPAAVLARGFCIARMAGGGPLHRASDVRPGDRLHVTLHQGGLDCRVENVHV